uniref:Carrier domain-containing protein n=1 Tax=Caenorhabditis tropicalis TaxID=1561998 RepID=A0A1I7TZN9_9PELO
MFEEFLDAPSVEGKVQQLIGFLIQKPIEEIDSNTNFKEVDPDRAAYFNTMIAEALTSHFNVSSESSDIEPLNTVQDIVDRINSA